MLTTYTRLFAIIHRIFLKSGNLLLQHFDLLQMRRVLLLGVPTHVR